MTSQTAALASTKTLEEQKPQVEGKATTPAQVVEHLLKGLYTLYYRAGNNPHAMSKNFFSSAKDLRGTVDIAKRHCETLNLRFVRVQSFLNDLRADERKHTGQEDGE